MKYSRNQNWKSLTKTKLDFVDNLVNNFQYFVFLFYWMIFIFRFSEWFLIKMTLGPHWAHCGGVPWGLPMGPYWPVVGSYWQYSIRKDRVQPPNIRSNQIQPSKNPTIAKALRVEQARRHPWRCSLCRREAETMRPKHYVLLYRVR